MAASRDLATTLDRIVQRRVVRRLRAANPRLRRVPSALVLTLHRRRIRRRSGAPASTSTPTITVVTCRIGDRSTKGLNVRVPEAEHICFTDRPEGVPSHWLVRPIEYWAATNDLTRSWIECHLPRLVERSLPILWVDPDTAETRVVDEFSRDRWIESMGGDRVGETATGSLRWFGDQAVRTRRRPDPSRATSLSTYSSSSPASIVVPVHNAPDHVERCLSSVVRTMREIDRLVIVDDGSTSKTQQICERYAELDRVDLIRRPTGSGFPAAANAGVEQCQTTSVIVLNSDTRVPRDWVARLVAHLERHPRVAAVGPVSNAARFQSVPFLPVDEGDSRNFRPEGLDLESLNVLLHAWSSGIGPIRVPLLNGFCLAFRRSALDDVGLFDTDAFPRGFGEENDWCQRAVRAGWGLLVATDVYVEHAKGRSYASDEVARLKTDAQRILAERYGREILESDSTAMRYPAALVALRADTQALWESLGGSR